MRARFTASLARFGLTGSTLRAGGLSFLYGTFIVQHVIHAYMAPHQITGASMSPTLSPAYHSTGAKDHVLIRRDASLARLRRGAVVLFWTPHAPERLAVKRVVALAGDVVTPVPRGPGRPGSAYEALDADTGEETRVVVPWGHVWVEGDNERATRDSNDYGPVSTSLIAGVATRIYWPWARRGLIDADGGVWKERCKSRIEWNEHGQREVPEEWKMH